MKPVGIFYATRQGQTKRIARYVAQRFEERGFETDVRDLATDADIDLEYYGFVVLAASVHTGHHESEMLKFIKRHRLELDAVPTAFVSVTLSQAGVERKTKTSEQRAQFDADIRKVMDLFASDTGWRPKRWKSVAGALLYTKYNFILRWIMKGIARKAGGDTDTSRDFEYTDWSALDRFVDDLCEEIRPPRTLRAAS
jgi:menaquinone-dependent protoporphyrinogen oxidase